MKGAVVRWIDASIIDEWSDLVKGGFEVESAGLIAAEDQDGIYLARDFDPDSGKWRGQEFIPRQNIIWIRRER